jgi:hypothetical protein
MNLLRRFLSTLRTWLGLSDAANDHLTPSHGWLLPDPVPVVAVRKDGTVVPAGPPLR